MRGYSLLLAKSEPRNLRMKYQLANLTFCPATKTVVKADGSVEKLRPQLANILTLFIENKGQLISSELLHSSVWKKRTVEDKTVQAALTKLRASLGWQADENLINERSEGYRLVCEVTELIESIEEKIDKPAETLAEKITTNTIVKPLYAALYVSLTLTLIIMLYVHFSTDHSVNGKTFTTKPITYIKGQELNPSLSPDGKYLAFTHAKSKTLQYQVKVKLLSSNQFLSVDEAEFSSTPSWSRNGSTLYYQAFTQEECWVKKVELIGEMTFAKPEIITSCGKEKSESPVVVDNDNEWLYFSYKTALNKPMQIKRINLNTEKVQQLTSPTEDAYGDYSLSLSPDGKTLAILTFDSAALGRAYLMNLQTKEQVLAFSYSHLLYNVSWAKDGESFFYIDQDAYIVQFNLAKKSHRQITKLSQPSQTIQVIKDHHFLVGFGEFYISDLYKATLGSYKTVQLQESYFNDHSITPISTSPEQYVFVSNRSGLQQIWLYNNGSLKQLTHYQKSLSIKELNLSGNASALVYLTDARLNVMDLKPKQPRYQQVASSDALFRSPIWHCNNHTILASTKIKDVWSLAEIKPSTGTVNILLQGVTGIKADCNNDKYYVTQEEKFGIYLLSNLANHLLGDLPEKLPESLSENIQAIPYLADYYLGSGRQWLVDNDVAYFVHQRAFYSTILNGSTEPVKHMSNINLKEFKILDAKLYFSEKVLNDSYIAQISDNGSKKQ
ncbi:transcriptional regulator [Colwellia marinimaniae]|uniref:Transcriptional regulator n=3 Tax=Colwellia TaxID=28228 RepID=A0ABQ0MYG9_9GAMM|nr:transcriptional regulator [Colwellia marinimaniae]